MKITKLNHVNLFVCQLSYRLRVYGIELSETSRTRSSVNIRFRRRFNKPYCSGGVKFGEGCAVNGFGKKLWIHGPFRQAKHLHWEEWAIINNLIHDICDEFDLGGNLKSYFDGELQWIRKNNIRIWDASDHMDLGQVSLQLKEAAATTLARG